MSTKDFLRQSNTLTIDHVKNENKHTFPLESPHEPYSRLNKWLIHPKMPLMKRNLSLRLYSSSTLRSRTLKVDQSDRNYSHLSKQKCQNCVKQEFFPEAICVAHKNLAINLSDVKSISPNNLHIYELKTGLIA
jgi:hypothetical protein